MSNAKPIVCHGVTYPTKSGFCKVNGIPFTAFHKLLNKGYTPEEALEQCLLMKNKVVYQSEEGTMIYKDEYALCLDLQIDYSTYLRYKKGGYQTEKLVELCRYSLSHNIAELPHKILCKLFDVPFQRYESLMKKGATADAALDACLILRGNQQGKAFEVCAILDVSYDKYTRLRRNGMDEDEALESCLNTRGRSFGVIYDNVHFSTRKELCEAQGIRYDSFIREQKKGLSIEEAVDILKKRQRKQTWVFINGNLYKSCRAYCREEGISLSTFQRLARTGKIKVERLSMQ